MTDLRGRWSRRRFLSGMTLAGTAGLLATRARGAAAEAPPETSHIRLYKFPGTCLAPQYLAEPLLRAEGFTQVEYVAHPDGAKAVYERVASGAVDITQWYLAPFIVAADRKAPLVFLSGVHVGCQELVATGPIRSVRELKGKTVVAPFGGALNSFVAAMLGHVGLDYRKDVNFVEKAARRGGPAPRRGQGRRVPGLGPARAGAARQEDRPRDRQHGDRSALVAVFLLHARREPGR